MSRISSVGLLGVALFALPSAGQAQMMLYGTSPAPVRPGLVPISALAVSQGGFLPSVDTVTGLDPSISPVQDVAAGVMPDLQTSPVPGMLASTVPDVTVAQVQDLSTGVMPDVGTSPIPGLLALTVPDVTVAQVQDLASGVMPDVGTSPVPLMYASTIPDVTLVPVQDVIVGAAPGMQTAPVPGPPASTVPEVVVEPLQIVVAGAAPSTAPAPPADEATAGSSGASASAPAVEAAGPPQTLSRSDVLGAVAELAFLSVASSAQMAPLLPGPQAGTVAAPPPDSN